MIPEAISAILALMQQVLPLTGAAGDSAALIGTIITALQKWAPIAIEEAPVAFHAIKNIITTLRADPSTTQDQLQTLQQLDAQVDTAFEDAAKDVDPDASVT